VSGLLLLDLRSSAGYPRDIKRLAKHFGVEVEQAQKKFTTTWQGEQILRRKADPIFGKACKFLDPDTRRCTIYHARPLVCREFPARPVRLLRLLTLRGLNRVTIQSPLVQIHLARDSEIQWCASC